MQPVATRTTSEQKWKPCQLAAVPLDSLLQKAPAALTLSFSLVLLGSVPGRGHRLAGTSGSERLDGGRTSASARGTSRNLSESGISVKTTGTTSVCNFR